MESKTVVAVTRLLCGAAIMIASMVTGENGTYQMIAMFLMSIPVEALQTKKKEA